MNPKSKIIVILCVSLGFTSVSYSQAIIAGYRYLPDSYVPGQTITVSLDLEIDESRRPEPWGAILKDFVPAGWTFVSASHSPDSWDPSTGEMKWVFVHGLSGQTMTDTSMDISYQVTPPSGETGDKTFLGQILYNDPVTSNPITETIVGDTQISGTEPLPIVEFDVAASEGLEDNSPAKLYVNISGESSQDVEVDYSVIPGTATSGQDYTPVSGTLTFPAGDTDPQTIKIPIIDDLLDEDNETFTVTLKDPENAILGTASHTYTILDNDDPPTVSFYSAGSQGEEAAVPQVTLVVDLSEKSGRTVTVGYTVSGTADEGEDYTLADGTLTFLSGATKPTEDIVLTILDDDFGEADETVIVTLSAASETVEPGKHMEYTYTILNDDLTITVAIDIKPGSDLNPINPNSQGVIPIAILTTDDFDASTVNPDTIAIGGRGVAVRGKSNKSMAHLEDVDGDGDKDLLVQVDTYVEDQEWVNGVVELTGTTFDGTAIVGYDEIIIVPVEE